MATTEPGYTKRCANCAFFAVVSSECFYHSDRTPQPVEAEELACSHWKEIMCEEYKKPAYDISYQEYKNCPRAGESSAHCRTCRDTPGWCKHGLYPYCPTCKFGLVIQEEHWLEENCEWICLLEEQRRTV